jgi:hypothetical protein
MRAQFPATGGAERRRPLDRRRAPDRPRGPVALGRGHRVGGGGRRRVSAAAVSRRRARCPRGCRRPRALERLEPLERHVAARQREAGCPRSRAAASGHRRSRAAPAARPRRARATRVQALVREQPLDRGRAVGPVGRRRLGQARPDRVARRRQPLRDRPASGLPATFARPTPSASRIAAASERCPLVTRPSHRAAKRLPPPRLPKVSSARRFNSRRAWIEARDPFRCPWKWSAEPLRESENRAVARFPKPSAGLEPATPSLPWKCSTN